MALNLAWDFRYAGRPIIPIRLTCWQTGKHLDTEAMLDTGADKTFVDSAIALALGIDLRIMCPASGCWLQRACQSDTCDGTRCPSPAWHRRPGGHVTGGFCR